MNERKTQSQPLRKPLRKLGINYYGAFAKTNPKPGIDQVIDLIIWAEELGLDSFWIRQRHLQYGTTSPVAILAAASKVTSSIELGSGLIPLAAENPLRIAEDLSTLDHLSGYRLNPGFSVGTPQRFTDYEQILYPHTFAKEDTGYARAERLVRIVRGDELAKLNHPGSAGEEFSNRVEPFSPTLVDRLWYGAASSKSVRWAAKLGLNLLTSSVIDGELSLDFDENQAHQIELYHQEYIPRLKRDLSDLGLSDTDPGTQGRVSQGLVVIPTDSATSTQREKYHRYAKDRLARTKQGVGKRNSLFSPDFVGNSQEVAERLLAQRAFPLVDEVCFALPFEFDRDDYWQITADIAEHLGPLLGWNPKGG